MPEGDTIYRAAQTLNRALAGRPVTQFVSVFPHLTRVDEDQPIVGREIDRVTSLGKHLLMHFSGGLVLRSHMRMHGSWHVYRPGEAWQRPASAMRILVGTDAFVAVAFNVHDAQFVAARSLGRDTPVGRLGPDLLAADFDLGEALRRLRARGDLTIGDALLNQQLLAGVGNVFKSEVLFACGISPFRHLAEIDDATLRRIVETARAQLRANVGTDGSRGISASGGLRRTTRRADPAERLWVYGRRGEPCRRCGRPVGERKLGTDARVTYWCATCQS